MAEDDKAVTSLNAFKMETTAKMCHFDPRNPVHLAAYADLEEGRQHPELRFEVIPKLGEPLFNDVVSLMRYRLAQAFLEDNLPTNKKLITVSTKEDL